MDPAVGFWLITPSNEFRSGGPLKQNLTSHVGPTTLAVSTTPNIKHTILPPDSYLLVLQINIPLLIMVWF